MPHAHWRAVGLAALVLALVAMPRAGASQDGSLWTQYGLANGLPSKTVWAIALGGAQGDVWVGTSRGASLYRDGRWYSYSRDHGLGADWVAALTVDPRQRVWFGTLGGGLTVLDGERWQTYTAANSGLGGDWISALASDARGRLWCGTWGQGVSVLDGGRWRTYTSDNSALPADFVTALAAGADGTVWVGLHGQGVARLASGRWTRYTTANGLADDFVSSLAASPDGSVWVGTAKGLNQLSAQGRILSTHTTAQGLPDDHIQALALDGAGPACADAAGRRLWVGTSRGAAFLEGGRWTVYRGHATLAHDYVSAIAAAPGEVWFGSLSSGVARLAGGQARLGTGAVASTRRLPVVLVHGWHGPASGRLEDSEFRFLAGWLREDGYPVHFAQGISPKNTLHRNAANLRKAIEQARRDSGADRVVVIAFSMGGLNTRAYIESSLYAGDVDQAFILGTPQAGVRLWYPFLLREIHEWSRDPSGIELTPEYAALFNALHANGAGVPYTLIVGDARGPDLPEALRGLLPGDGLISAGSALALEGPQVRKAITDDLHAWSSETILLGLPSFLYPRRTYDAHIRNRLRLGADVRLPGVVERPLPELAVPEVPVHSPFYGGQVAPGQSVSDTVLVDTRGEVRFYLRSQEGALTFSLVDPQGRQLDAETIGERGEHFDLGLANFQSYVVREAQPGPWKVVVGRPAETPGAVRFTGYAVFESPLWLSVQAGAGWWAQGAPVAITATLRQGGRPMPRAKSYPDQGVEVEIGRPDLQVDRLTLFDDGEHGDGGPLDGVYGGVYHPPNLGGHYTLFATARGTLANTAFARTAGTLFAVSPGTALLTGNYAETAKDANRNGRFDALALQVGIDARAAGEFLLGASLVDRQGREIGRVVTPVALNAGRQTVTLRFPGLVLLRARTDGPYTIGRVTLLDATGAAVLLQEANDVLHTRPYRYQDFEGP